MSRIAGALAALIGVVMSGSAMAQETTVRIQDYPGTGNPIFRIAAAKGYCEKHGLKCVLQQVPSGPLGVQGLLAGSLDVAFAPSEVMINAAVKGSDIAIIGSGLQRTPFVLVAKPDFVAPELNTDIKGLVHALKGKRIGVPARGSGAELQFQLLAADAGVDISEFTLVAVGAPNTSHGALMSGQIDASMTFEPSASLCEVLKTCKVLYIAADAPEPAVIARTNPGATVLAVTRDTINKNPNLVESLLAAAKEAEAFAIDPANFEDNVKISRSFFELKLEGAEGVTEAVLKRVLPSVKIAVSRDAVQQVADNLLTTKQLTERFDTSAIIYDKAP